MENNSKAEGKEGDQRRLFGRILRKIRKTRGLTIKDFTKSSGIDGGYISRIENGRRNPPSVKLLKRMAGTLRIDVVYLIMAAGYLKYNPVSGKELTEADIVFEIESVLKKELRKI